MSTSRNKAIVRAFIEEAVVGFMQGERDDFHDFLSSDVVFHTPRLTTPSGGAEGLHAEVTAYGDLVANPNLVVDFVIAEDDFVVIHLTRHTRPGVPESTPSGGDPAETGGMAILRVRDERITDVWYYRPHSETEARRSMTGSSERLEDNA